MDWTEIKCTKRRFESFYAKKELHCNANHNIGRLGFLFNRKLRILPENAEKAHGGYQYDYRWGYYSNLMMSRGKNI